jgi:sulfate adenylyltransferase
VPDLDSIEGLPVWHPPLDVLEIAELVVTGALEAEPGLIEPPDDLAAAPAIVVEDAEGTPVARLERPAGAAPSLSPLRPFTHGPVRAARRTPAQIRADVLDIDARGGTIAVPLTGLPGRAGVEWVIERAGSLDRSILWLGVVGAGRAPELPPTALWRAVQALTDETRGRGVPSVAAVVAVPESAGGARLEAVARAYGGAEIVPIGRGNDTPHPIFAAELARAVRPPGRRGVTVFFTGLSGSGKSTVAKALADRLAESTGRTVSLLDGDEVRRLLSAGLGFSRADRDLNIRRIGFVATEVTRHGGIAVCAPIAPFEQARAQVRSAVEEVGDFVLVHVCTPLAECERRDRKGLYAKARQGLIPDFTGISSPYEVPARAELRLDTSDLPVPAALEAVWSLLSARGYLGDDA